MEFQVLVYSIFTAPGYGSAAGVLAGANPYYARFSTSESSTVIDDAAATGAFFTLWIGNNDILGYASSGGSGVDNNETGSRPVSITGTIALQITIRLRECMLHL
jgi:hypothetical protein